jgi:hypothetical protein
MCDDDRMLPRENIILKQTKPTESPRSRRNQTGGEEALLHLARLTGKLEPSDVGCYQFLY